MDNYRKNAGDWFRVKTYIYILVLLGVLLIFNSVWSCRDAPYIAPVPVGTIANPPAVVLPPAMPVSSSTVGPFVYTVPNQPFEWSGQNPNRIGNRPIGSITVQESATLRIEVRKDYGGSLQIYDKVTGQYLINFFDNGRQSGLASYAGPLAFADDSPRWKGIGYNPLQTGDDGGNPSPVLFHGLINGYMYTKTQCLSWAHQNARRLPFFYEQWVRLDENKVHVKVRITHERPDKTFYNFYEQEWPFMMVNGARAVHFYTGSTPFANAPVTISNGVERGQGRSAEVQQSTTFRITEPWQGVEISANRLIGLYAPDFYQVNYNVANYATQDNGEGGSTITYAGGRHFILLDSDNVWYREYTYVVGSESEIRDYVYAQPRPTLPDFRFDVAHGRSGWFIIDGGHDQKEPFRTNNWTVTYDGHIDNGPINARGTKLISPVGCWRAADMDTLYIRMGYTGPEKQLYLTWLLNGQARDGVDSNYPIQNAQRIPRGVRASNEQFVPFAIINDGKIHTYRLLMKGLPKWQDIVQQFELTHTNGSEVIKPGEVVELAYMGVNNPGN